MKSAASKIAIGIILFAVIVVPIVRMFLYIDGEALSSVFSSDVFYKTLVNSLTSTFVATFISMAIAYALAWSINRTNMKFKSAIGIILVLPMLIPSISHGMGLIILFGNNGIITRLFSLSSSVYGFWGVVSGSVLYSFPVAFLMISDILKYEDYSPYEAADVLGIPRTKQFCSITFPYMRKPLISVVFATFTMIVTDYGVPLSVGGQFKTLPVMLYENAVGQLDYSSGSVIGLVLLVPAVVAFLFDLFNKDKGNSSYITKRFAKTNSIARDIIGYCICGAVAVFTLMVISSFCIQAFAQSYPSNLTVTFRHFENTFNKNGIKYLFNSILISILTAGAGTLLAFVTAYLAARVKSGMSKFLHLMSITSLAVPGLVLGLAYVIVFKRTFIYGTLAILIMVNTVHFFASPYLMMYNVLGKMNGNLEDVGHVMGISRFKIIKNVIIPQSKYTLIEMFAYYFVNSMMTISAVSFLSTPSNKPLSLMINQFETYNMMECAAVIALLILTVNVLMKATVYIIKRLGEKHNDIKKAV